MNNSQGVKMAITSIFGVVGAGIAKLFGGWSMDLVTLIIFMAIDFVTGLIVAGVFHKSQKTEGGAVESKAGWKGVSRKGVTLLIVLVAHRLDVTLGIDYVRSSVIIGYIVNEVISITENAGLMGVPLPKKIVQAIELLRNGSEKEG